jgi:hypothetical protein
MSGLYYLVFLIGFVLIVYWARRNDATPPTERTVGLLRTSKGAAKDTDGSDKNADGSDKNAPTGIARFRVQRNRR